MRSNLRRGVAVLIGAAAAATSISVATPASAAPAKRLIYAIYQTSAECRAAGDALVRVAYARDYQCLWDSPGFALWVDTVK
jgi:hypothetical protein